MTIKQALAFGIEKLEKQNIDSANLDAELLLIANLYQSKNKSTQINQSFLYTHPEFELTKSQIAKYKKLISRRAKGEPIAYLTGHKEFFGLDFLVNKNVLIPRPETELLVEECLIRLSPPAGGFGGHNSIFLIDIGTGSGCIPIAILKNLPITNYKLRIKTIATDISANALQVARKNAKLHKVNNKIKFIKSDLLDFFLSSPPAIGFASGKWRAGRTHASFASEARRVRDLVLKIPRYARNDINLVVTANLPYLPNKKISNTQAEIGLKFEPKEALFSGKDGLLAYRKLFSQIAKLPNCKKTIFCEIGYNQKTKFTKIISQHFSPKQAKLYFKKDLAGNIRLAVVEVLGK